MTSVGFVQITKFELQESHDLALRVWKMKPACRRVFLRLKTVTLEASK